MASQEQVGVDAQKRLEGYRRQIDQLDRDLVELLNRRAMLSIEIGKLKSNGDIVVFQPDREAVVFAQLEAANRGPLSNDAVRAIYREILSSSRALQRAPRIAYLGPAATYTHEAAQRRFGTAAKYVACKTIADVFQETSKGGADYGVVPVENSTEGAVNNTLDVFVDTDLRICAEIEMPISHTLLSHGQLPEIRRVFSKAEAIGQCRRWLAEHVPTAELVEVASTALAVKMLETPDCAAIASASASAVYGVPIRAERIEDIANNVTRFIVIGPKASKRTGNDRTAVVFSVRDRVGALHDALETFSRHGVNLTRIESRPSKKRLWDYIFFTNLTGHPDDPSVAAALEELTRECSFVRVLGAWPVE